MPDLRLAAAASLVRRDSPVCDVGTDHGKLAVYLVEEGITRRVTASDVNEGPLEAARRNVKAHGLAGQIRLVLSDGLKEIPPEDAQDIVICGMGGELIASIVLDCAYSRTEDVRLILQPMTQAAYLRERLSREGFLLLREIPVSDRNHHYTVMHWRYDGNPKECTQLFLRVGKVPESGLPGAEGYLEAERRKAEKIAAGLEKSGGKQIEAAEWLALAQEITAVMRSRRKQGCQE